MNTSTGSELLPRSPSAGRSIRSSRSSSFRCPTSIAPSASTRAWGGGSTPTFAFDNGFRVVQFTPPGSACSIQFGAKITSAAPGSAQGLYLVVSDIEAARDELVARGVEVSEVFHADAPGAQFQPDGTSGRVSGPAPDHASYRSFATFSDPDGNGWLLQEITTRLPGRGLSNLDVATLTELLREAEKRHGEYEPTAPKHHWSEWYAAYIVAREQRKTPEEAAKDGALHIEGARR